MGLLVVLLGYIRLVLDRVVGLAVGQGLDLVATAFEKVLLVTDDRTDTG